MKKLGSALALGVFGSTCLLGWAMLTLMSEIKSAGRVLPDFTNLCMAVRPALLVFPLVAAAYYLVLLFRKEQKVTRWMGFEIATMAVLLLFVVPAMATSYLLMVEQVRAAVVSR